MGTVRIILQGASYAELRYYGKLQWDDRNVYLRHPGGQKDSRHSDGRTYIGSAVTTEPRNVETRLPTSSIGRELLNYISLPSSMSEPDPLRGAVQSSDLVIPTTSAGTIPRLAVEIVDNGRVPGVLAAWAANSTAPSVQTFIDKGLGQSLVVAVAGSLSEPPSTGPA